MALNLNKGGKLGKYYYIVNNVQYGPVDIGELSKYINKDTLIYFEGINWTKASQIPELEKFFLSEKKSVDKEKVAVTKPKETKLVETKPVETKPVETKPVETKPVETKPVEQPLAPKKNHFITILFTLIVFGGVYWLYDYQVRSKYEKEQELIMQRKKIEEDSIASEKMRILNEARQDSLNNKMNSKLDSMRLIEKKVIFLQNQGALIEKIKNYYFDISNNQFDAFSYYSDTIFQFITLYNVTPESINANYLNKQDYLDEVFLVDESSFIFNRYSENVFYFNFNLGYECYRPMKNKNQKCDIDIEIGFDENFKIKSYKEMEIRNLTFE